MKAKTAKTEQQTGFVFIQDLILKQFANLHALKVGKSKTLKGEEWISLDFFFTHPNGKIFHRDISLTNLKWSGSGGMLRQDDIVNCLKRNKVKLPAKKQYYSFGEVINAMQSNNALKFRGVDWPKIQSYIQIQYTKTEKGKKSQAYIALVLKNGGEMIHPYMPSSYDLLGEQFVLVK